MPTGLGLHSPDVVDTGWLAVRWCNFDHRGVNSLTNWGCHNPDCTWTEHPGDHEIVPEVPKVGEHMPCNEVSSTTRVICHDPFVTNVGRAAKV